MSKYNQYAKRLAEAFIAARDEYNKAYNAYTDAKRNYDNACNMWHESYTGEKEYKKVTTRGNYEAAKRELEHSAIWANYDNSVKTITEELKAEVAKNSNVDPESVDNAALALLQSGVMGISDFAAMRSKYDGNNTMLRLLSRYAEAAADAMPDDRFKDRAELRAIAEATKHGDAAIINEWNNLVTMAYTLSGGNDRLSPDYIVNMNGKFENLVGKAIDSF